MINFIALPSGLEVATTLVTRALWQKVMGYDTDSQGLWESEDWKHKSLRCPVTHVSAIEARAFCVRVGDRWRLPTAEEQTEYSCPLPSRFPFDDYVIGNWNYDEGPPPVARKKPMPNGLFDTHGLVLEWTSDNKLFGSVWYKHPLVFSSADLGWSSEHRYSAAGFRVVRGPNDTN